MRSNTPSRRRADARAIVRHVGLLAILTLLGGGNADATPGEITFTVSFDDPLQELNAATRTAVEDHVRAAGAEWDASVAGSADIEVQVVVTRGVPRATGRSQTSAFVGSDGLFNVFEQGMAAELRTGADPNGPAPDVELAFNPNYLAQELWLDPDPCSRSAPVPANRTDAMSVFVHELGHALAYNGWIDGVTGQLPGDFRSPFDAWVVPGGGDFFFAGPNVVALRGVPAAITFGNPWHWGNAPPRAGSELIPELMNGVVFDRGVRYTLTPLDRATLADVGVAIADGLPGDYDGNGVVESNDFVVWSRGYGDARVVIADGTHDGLVDAADYTLWRDAAAATTSPAVAPEPQAFVGMVALLLTLTTRRLTP